MIKLKACHISDTHDAHQDLNSIVPEGIDILFVTGDFTYKGNDWELIEFLGHMRKLKARIKHIVVIPGNHELGCEERERLWRYLFKRIGVYFLIHESVQIEGINIFGSAWTPEFFDWAYNIPKGQEEKMWGAIPSNTQVLLTHGPPHEILDRCSNGNVGCPVLRRKILYDLPVVKYHMFGHIHEGYGTLEKYGILFSNGSLMNNRYKFVNKPILFDIII